jgi:hypothetical protein
MFDYEPPKENKTDRSGAIIGLSMLPIFFLFVYLGKAELGFGVTIVATAAVLAIKLRWELSKHVWFWVTIAVVFALHIPLLLVFQWPPHTGVPTLFYTMPMGIADFFIMSGAISLAQRLFLRDSSADGGED